MLEHLDGGCRNLLLKDLHGDSKPGAEGELPLHLMRVYFMDEARGAFAERYRDLEADVGG